MRKPIVLATVDHGLRGSQALAYGSTSVIAGDDLPNQTAEKDYFQVMKRGLFKWDNRRNVNCARRLRIE